MKTRFLVGAALGTILVAASCSSATEDGGPATPAPDEPTAAAAAVDPAAAIAAAPKRARRANGLLPGMKARRTVGPSPTPDTVTPTCSSPKLTYYDGPIVMAPQVVTVFWSKYVNTALTAPTTGIAQFFTDVIQDSGYLGWLQEYDTVGITKGTEQAILTGSMIGTVTLVPSVCASTTKCTVSDTQIQSELNKQIASSALPAPVLDCTGNTQTIYMISFPPNVTITGPDGAGTSCSNGGFCAYHNTGTYSTSTPLIYGVLTDEFTSGCDEGCGNGTAMENTTSTASHELIEAMTDPDIGLIPETAQNIEAPAGWYDQGTSTKTDCGEIADICDTGAADTITVSGRTWSVQEVWSNAQGKCTSTGPDPAVCSGQTPTSGCRKCSCGDTGNACAGGTGVCETTSTNVLFGSCEQCTSLNATACGTAACAQSSTATSDDICPASCVPLTTCPTGDNCGTVSNGCGGTVTCGTCATGETCTNNVCGGGTTCLTTCPAGDNCGTLSNNCGGTLVCGTTGTCPTGETCTNNVCGTSCVPLTACPTGDNCGTISNGCGGTLVCGTTGACPTGQTCTANVCVTGCLSACPAGTNCGTLSNNCGGTLLCGGTCTAPETCGGGTPGVANVCGGACVPETSCAAGLNCGTVSDGCGGMITCGTGTCTAPDTCGGGNPGVANVCGGTCTPLTACPTGACGTMSDGCTGTLTCTGTCTAPQTCGGGNPGVANTCGCTPISSCVAGYCGDVPDGCGGMFNCGTCPTGQVCDASTNLCGAAGATTSSSSSGTTSSSSGSTTSSSSGGGAGGGSATTTSSSSSGGGAGGGTTTTTGVGGSTFGVGGSGGSVPTTTTVAGAGGGGPFTGNPGSTGGCSCEAAGDAPGTSSASLSAFGALALAVTLRNRRRRSN